MHPLIQHSLTHFADTAQAVCNVDHSAVTECNTGLPEVGATQANLQVLLQILFGILAIVAVIIIVVWGALRYITDAGNPQQMTKARNSIIYATVGLIIAISGEVIVSFALNRL